MICAGCEDEIPDGGTVCLACNEPELYVVPADVRRELSAAVRRLKALVVMSFVFGLFVAPFAIVAATNVLRRYPAVSENPGVLKEVLNLRWIAVSVLILWSFVIGAQIAWLSHL